MTIETKKFETLKIEKEEGITWLYFNRPEKRNAMNPTLHREMWQALEELEEDPETKVLVLTGAGDVSWSAGQDLKQSFWDRQGQTARRRLGREDWRSDLLPFFPAPTVAMVNGYVMGGAFTALIGCDIAIAAEDAVFCLSEINWGMIPGGLVTRAVADALSYRDGLYYIMMGEPFDGKKASEMRLVNRAVPRDQLRQETVKICQELMKKNPYVLRACKEAFKFNKKMMDYPVSREYLSAKGSALRATDPERGQVEGMKQFLFDKTYRPGFGAYQRKEEGESESKQ